MDSRERVMLALRFEEPDRIPIDFWGSAGFFDALCVKRGITKEEFIELTGADLRYIEGPRYVGPMIDEGSDIWGVPRRSVKVETSEGEETYKEVVMSPLKPDMSLDEISEYPHWPSADWFDYSGIASQCDEVISKGKIVVFMGDRLNRIAQLKPAIYLRGYEQILVDMLVDTDVAGLIFQKIATFYKEYLDRILEAAKGKIDIILTGDDFGEQRQSLVSPETWISLLRKGFSRFNEIIHTYGAMSMHHTCGNVIELAPHLVEGGLDILQSLQPEAMSANYEQLKQTYHGKLCFHGGMSIQNTLPFGSPEDISAEVKRLMEVLSPGGGYIISTAHNVQSDCSLENVDALIRAYHRFGNYG